MTHQSIKKKWLKLRPGLYGLLHGLETVEQFIPVLFTCFVVISFKIVF